MKIEVDNRIRERGEVCPCVDYASQLLQEEIGPSRFSEDVTAEWTLRGEQYNGEKVQLRMFDPLGSFAAEFSPKELGDENRLLANRRRPWIRLLQVRSEKQSEKICELIAKLDAADGK